MTLYLVQHGQALSKQEDPERGLTQEGMAETRRIAEVARGYHVPVKAIRHSGKKRSLQTAVVFAEALAPPDGVQSLEGLGPMDDVTALAEQLDPADNTMLVSHLPFLERLASFLVVGDQENLVFKLQNGGLLCLDREPNQSSWFIRWALMPKVGVA